MPKLKTHSGTKDRVKVSKKGKIQVRRSHSNHFLEGKSASRKRTFAGVHELSGKVVGTIRKKLAI